MLLRSLLPLSMRGAIAQLVARYIRIVEVRGSNPLSSITVTTLILIWIRVVIFLDLCPAYKAF